MLLTPMIVAQAISTTQKVTYCRNELFPVGTGFPLHSPPPDVVTTQQLQKFGEVEAARTDNDVIAVDKVVLRSSKGSSGSRLIAYRYTLADGKILFQTIPTRDPYLLSRQKTFFYAGGLKDNSWVFTSSIGGTMPLRVTPSVLRTTGTAIVPCTRAH